MNAALRVLCRVIGRRLSNGESFDDIIISYPALSEYEIKIIKDEFGIADQG